MSEVTFTVEWDEGDLDEWQEKRSPQTFNPTKAGDATIQFEYTEMYDPPPIKMAFLSALATYFGTTDVDVVGSIAMGGCETCDYGSIYGHEISVRNITRNNPFEAQS